MVAGGLTALCLRVPTQISERFQGHRWWKAVERANDVNRTPAQRAEARLLAEKFEKAMPKKEWDDIAKTYKTTVGIAAVEGAGVANIPQFHDLFLPHDNPERRAYEEYIKRLPKDHSEIQRTIDLLKDMPEENPARKAALKHFGHLYPAIVTAVEGALESGFTAAMGTTASKAIGPFETGLPRSETQAMIEAAAKRSKTQRSLPGARSGGSEGPTELPSPAARKAPPSPRPSSKAQRQPTREEQSGPPTEGVGGAKPETWEAPSGEVIKRGKGGSTWHKPDGEFSSPPPKGSRRTSFLDPFRYWGGYFG